MVVRSRQGVRSWLASGEPWIWLNALAVAVSVIAVVGVVLLIAVRGLAHFWPAPVALFEVAQSGQARLVLGEVVDRESLGLQQFRETAQSAADDHSVTSDVVTRVLVKTGNRRAAPPDFRWLFEHRILSRSYPADAVVLERAEWGNAYGFLESVYEGDALTATGPDAWAALERRLAAAQGLRERIEAVESGRLKPINRALEQLRMEARRLERADAASARSGEAQLALEARRARLLESYRVAEAALQGLYERLREDRLTLRLADERIVEVNFADLVRAWRPNAMSPLQKLGHYGESLWSFLSGEPREANTEGGVFPALFGTVMMVMLMSVLVTPLGVIAAVYLREYARQGPFVRLMRIAVNNLAGVPSIVYGVFGLGFFVYFIGGSIDELFFTDALPAPTFGTPGLLWASLTLALLTVPVVVVSTEEGLTRIPRSIREGSLALGATQAETLFKVVLPMASPSILTGVILAVARAAGEVAPLMLVGVVKLAPALPVDGNFPFLHLDRKFMHLGFHIYDVGFQSPNVEAARPVVFATALLLVLLIFALNLTAITLRNQLEKRYRGVEG